MQQNNICQEIFFFIFLLVFFLTFLLVFFFTFLLVFFLTFLLAVSSRRLVMGIYCRLYTRTNTRQNTENMQKNMQNRDECACKFFYSSSLQEQLQRILNMKITQCVII